MFPLLLALASPVSVQPIDADRFRLTIIYGGDHLTAHAQALIELASEARRQCRNRGEPVSAGSLELNEVPKTDTAARKKGRLSLSEEWRCVPAR